MLPRPQHIRRHDVQQRLSQHPRDKNRRQLDPQVEHAVRDARLVDLCLRVVSRRWRGARRHRRDSLSVTRRVDGVSVETPSPRLALEQPLLRRREQDARARLLALYLFKKGRVEERRVGVHEGHQRDEEAGGGAAGRPAHGLGMVVASRMTGLWIFLRADEPRVVARPVKPVFFDANARVVALLWLSGGGLRAPGHPYAG